MPRTPATRPPKFPTHGRSFPPTTFLPLPRPRPLPLSLPRSLPLALTLTLTLTLAAPAHAQPAPPPASPAPVPAPAARAHPLTERDVVRLAQQRDPHARLARELAAEHDALAVEAGLYPNPELGWTREHIPGSGPLAEREDSFVLTVPIELSGRRAARSALSRSQAAQARALAARARGDAVLGALFRFYAAIAAEQRVRIARDAAARLSEAARVLARRFEEGTASGYDRTRIELEAELGLSELREAEANAAAEQIELAAWLGLTEDALELDGDLALADGAGDPAHTPAPTPTRTPTPAVAPRSLALAREAVAEARRAQDSAGSAWVPRLAASGGLRMAHAAAETEYGYVAGLALDLPIAARGQDVRAQANARANLASAQEQALAREMQAGGRRAAAELAAARAELTAFTAATFERVEQLERAAQSAYREGQRSVLELLDAQRAGLAVELRKLELALSAKRAEAALRAARGEFE